MRSTMIMIPISSSSEQNYYDFYNTTPNIIIDDMHA